MVDSDCPGSNLGSATVNLDELTSLIFSSLLCKMETVIVLNSEDVTSINEIRH